jgi:hypothetical protein
VVVRSRWAGLKAPGLEVYTVTGMRKETAADGTHRHITEVCTQGGIRHTRQGVPLPEDRGCGGAPASDPVDGPEMPLGHRSSKVLAAIAAQPGACNREIADAAEVADQGQISKVLARLRNLGLIHDPGQWRVGEPHSWRLTARGQAY